MAEGRPTYEQVLAEVQAVVDGFRRERGTPEVLEAGCGSASHFDPGADARVVGVDVSQRQLDRNEGLAERIVGDVQALDLGGRQFDIVVCWDVLEHLERPRAALDGLVRALRPGGLLILALPNVLSLKGLVAKLTPHRAHVLVYRYVFGNRDAGTHDVGPFKTHLRAAIAPPALRRFAGARGLRVRYFATYESPMQLAVKERYRALGALWRAGEAAVRAATGGRLRPGATDLVLVLEKPLG